MSRPITESRMASTTSFFFLPTNTMATTLKTKRRCCSSFFITDILRDEQHSTTSEQKKDCEYDDETMLHDSEDNGKDTVSIDIELDLVRIDSDTGEETSTSDGGTHGSNMNSLKATKKPRKARTAFTDQQLNCLEKSFERQKYLSVQDRMELAARLHLSDTQVKTWYQNRRFVS